MQICNNISKCSFFKSSRKWNKNLNVNIYDTCQRGISTVGNYGHFKKKKCTTLVKTSNRKVHHLFSVKMCAVK